MIRLVIAGALFLVIVAAGRFDWLRQAVAAGAKEVEHQPSAAKPEGPQKSAAEEMLGIEKRRKELMEKEAALAAKEQELNRLSTNLDAKIKALNAAQKTYETALNEKKKKETEQANAQYMKMFKLLKAMKPDEAAKIMDKLEEPVAIGLLERYDQKTVLKLSKYISQPRLMKWIRQNLEEGQAPKK